VFSCPFVGAYDFALEILGFRGSSKGRLRTTKKKNGGGGTTHVLLQSLTLRSTCKSSYKGIISIQSKPKTCKQIKYKKKKKPLKCHHQIIRGNQGQGGGANKESLAPLIPSQGRAKP
jgi:hypothetical protein